MLPSKSIQFKRRVNDPLSFFLLKIDLDKPEEALSLYKKYYLYKWYRELDGDLSKTFHRYKRSIKDCLKAFNIILTQYKALSNSEVYDPSFCKLGLYLDYILIPYLGFSLPEFEVVNLDNDKVYKLYDMFLQLKGDNLYVKKTTRDINFQDFIHPHIRESFCAGSSPFKANVVNLNYNFATFSKDDADIFWINFKTQITQKTADGQAHFFDLNALDKGQNKSTDKSFLLKEIRKNKKTYQSFIDTLDISLNSDAIKIEVNKELFKLYFPKVCFYNSKTNKLTFYKKQDYGQLFYFDGKKYEGRLYKDLYSKESIHEYSNLPQLLVDIVEKDIKNKLNTDKLYDNYKKTSTPVDNGGEDLELHQILELEMS